MTPSTSAERDAIYSVPIGLPESQLSIVKTEIETTLLGLARDLAHLDGKPDPGKFVSEVAAYARLAVALRTGTLNLPDRVGRKALRRLSEELDDRNDYHRVVAEHEAFRSFDRLLKTSSGRPRSSRGWS